MKIKINVKRNEVFDIWCPFVAKTEFRGLSFSGASPQEATSNVKGAVLHCLGDFEHPPDTVEFEVEEK